MLRALDAQVVGLDFLCCPFRNSLITLEKTQEDNRKASLKVTKQHDEMMRERDLMRKDLKKAEGKC